MADDSKVVIKINYQGKKRNIADSTRQEIVTKWHIQRILTAVILLMLILFLSFVFIFDDTVEQQSNVVNESKKDIKIKNKDISNVVNEEKPVNGIKQTINNVKPVEYGIHAENNELEINTKPEVVVDKRITRTFLTSALINKEPVDSITSPVIISKIDAIRLYYFTEIIDMKGQSLYHLWLLNGKVIFKRKINILGNRWRASTSILMSNSKSGFWKVRLINNEGAILNEIKFKVIKE